MREIRTDISSTIWFFILFFRDPSSASVANIMETIVYGFYPSDLHSEPCFSTKNNRYIRL